MTASQHTEVCDENKCRSAEGSSNAFDRISCAAVSPEEPLVWADGYEGRFVNAEESFFFITSLAETSVGHVYSLISHYLHCHLASPPTVVNSGARTKLLQSCL